MEQALLGVVDRVPGEVQAGASDPGALPALKKPMGDLKNTPD